MNGSIRFRKWNYPISALFSALLLWPIGCATARAASGDDQLFTSEHLAKLRSVGSAAISPDGKLIAYTLRVPRKPFVDDDGQPWSELHVVGVDGPSRPFITGEVDVSAIAWKPDGSGISFLTKRGKDEFKSLYFIPIDGGEARRLLQAEADISGYSWSPDGKECALLATEVAPKNRKNRKDKGFKQEIYEEDWQPVRVWIASISDDAPKPRMLDLPGSASELHWSRAGRQLAMALAPTPLVDDEYMKRRVHVVDVDSGKATASFNNVGKLAAIRWSPDGQRIAMIAAEDIHDPSAGRLYVAPAGGGPLGNVLPNYEGAVADIAWQDNETVMFLGDVGVWTTLGEVRFDGTGVKTHVPTLQGVYHALTLSKDGQSASMALESPAHPTEVALIRHGDKAPRKLTDSNPWLSSIKLAPQEVVRFKARDGLALEGILVRPLNEQKGAKYPLIMCVHGGPEAHDRNGWVTTYGGAGQVAAAKGFAVFYPNYRGSTGRGVAFSKLGQTDFAGKEFDDLVDAIDHLASTGLVDPKKVGITGGSYGGYASAWAATKLSDRFAAAVMFVGVSNQISMYGTSDIPEEWYLVHARKRLWEDWKFYLERSPIYYVQNCRTPILIMHGKDDPRVDSSQSLELYRHLKTLGEVPVRLVYYPGEGHGNRKSAARYDYNLRMLQWFEHYLAGPGGAPPAFDLEYPLDAAEAPDTN